MFLVKVKVFIFFGLFIFFLNSYGAEVEILNSVIVMEVDLQQTLFQTAQRKIFR